MNKIQYTPYVADFETTVYEGQTKTEVWASAIIPLNAPTAPENVIVENNIDSFMEYCFNFAGNKKIYFHNLKFDGSFIIPWLYHHGFQLWSWGEGKEEKLEKGSLSYMPARTFIPMISDMGQWYSITCHWKHKYVTFVDSLKLLPFSVDAIGKAFDTKYRKLSIEYTGLREPGGFISDEERSYIKNDVLVVQEALKKLFDMVGEEKMTIGSLCLDDFIKTCFHDKKEYESIFPDLTQHKCPIEGFKDTDEYIRKAYHGGWCYVKKGCENALFKNGCTADVNSLYPSMMHSDSGNYFPYGTPKYFEGDIPENVLSLSKENRLYYFVRIRTMFHVKPKHLPCIQIKNNALYNGREWLETSDINGMQIYRDFDEKIQTTHVTMTLTQTDFELIKGHYDLTDLEILDGCYFRCIKGIFDPYIDKWAEIKQKSKGAMRTLAKLFLNNLYGKLATSRDSSYKIPFLLDDVLHAKVVKEYEKKAGHIACGAAITSYARNFTIRHAQENFDHFVYADTDSIHCKCHKDRLKNIRVHPTAFNAWKIENEWDKAIFARAKTYIEHTVKEDGEDVEPYYMIKCAGMGKNAKKVLNGWLEEGTIKITDFKKGLVVPNNLKAVQIDGGTILVDMPYVMR